MSKAPSRVLEKHELEGEMNGDSPILFGKTIAE